MNLRVGLNFFGDRLHGLPLGIVYVTERCNSRCVTCDFWKNGVEELSVERARELADGFRELGTEAVLLTGGEVLFHPRWDDIAEAFRSRGLALWLLTAGLSLEKQVERVDELCERVTVSLDGATRETYRAIRGVDAFQTVLDGIGALVDRGTWVSLRCTVQRGNYLEMPELVRLARHLNVRQISFFPVDVDGGAAFGRGEDRSRAPMLDKKDLPRFREVLSRLERELAEEIASGFVAESPEKLRRLLQVFAAHHGLDELPPVRCNAPRFSIVVRANGALQPCHFIEGRPPSGSGTLARDLNDPQLMAIRGEIRRGEREACLRCVCPSFKAPRELVRARPFGV